MNKKPLIILGMTALVAAFLISVGLHNHALQSQALIASPAPNTVFSQPAAPARPRTFLNVSSTHQNHAAKNRTVTTHKSKKGADKQSHHKAVARVQSKAHASTARPQDFLLTHSPFRRVQANMSQATRKVERVLRINMGNRSFSPARIAVKVGTTIIWTNTSMVPHTVTIDTGP